MQATLERAETNEETREEFHIVDEAAALWYLRKLANLQAERQRVKRQAEAMIAALDTETESLKHRFAGELEHWAREELQRKGNRRKTLHTLQATLRFRKVEGYLSIAEEVPAIEYADNEELSQCLAIKWELNRPAYLDEARRRLEATGELLPGVRVVPDRESFTVSFVMPEEN